MAEPRALAVEGRLDADELPRTVAALAEGIDQRLQLGGQIYLAQRGRVLADAGFGAARPGEAMRRDHLMLWMSSTKPLAALAIAWLWERGALGLDDPVARHIPEFAAGGKEKVTVRHLLTHTGGLRMLDTGWPALGWDGIVAKVCAQRLEPRWTPGRKAGYHLASSWFVLGELVRRLDGRPFERWVRDELFLPLGCEDAWVGMPPARYRAYGGRLAPMFASGEGEPTPLALDAEASVVTCSPGGNGWGPLRDLARVYELLAAGGTLGGLRLLAPQTVEAIRARHRVGLIDQTFRTRLDWGLGVIVNSAHYGDPALPYGYGPHAGPRTYGHSGARSSCAFHDPDAELVVALAVNGMPSDEVHRERFAKLTAAIYEDLGIIDAA